MEMVVKVSWYAWRAPEARAREFDPVLYHVYIMYTKPNTPSEPSTDEFHALSHFAYNSLGSPAIVQAPNFQYPPFSLATQFPMKAFAQVGTSGKSLHNPPSKVRSKLHK